METIRWMGSIDYLKILEASSIRICPMVEAYNIHTHRISIEEGLGSKFRNAIQVQQCVTYWST